MTDTLFIRPVDVLCLRGNRLFGTAGDYAEAVMPPWPSVFSGAVRSRVLVDRKIKMKHFLQDSIDDAKAHKVLGSPRQPGTFRVTTVGIGWNGKVWYPAPYDLVAQDGTDSSCQAINPVPLSEIYGTRSSYQLPNLPILREQRPSKKSRFWISSEGLADHLAGRPVESRHLLSPQKQLWAIDPRLGIALDPATGSVETGKIYTTDAIALRPEAGFVVEMEGTDGLAPKKGLLRLGGDGRGATVSPYHGPSPSHSFRISLRGNGFRMILATPGIFPEGEHGEGWIPPGVFREETGWVLRYKALAARLVAAAVPGLEIVSGWDIAEHRPKPAVRAAPAGSVYWFQVEEGSMDVLEDLRNEGLWPLVRVRLGSVEGDWAARRAEGFNNVWIGVWHNAPGQTT